MPRLEEKKINGHVSRHRDQNKRPYRESLKSRRLLDLGRTLKDAIPCMNKALERQNTIRSL